MLATDTHPGCLHACRLTLRLEDQEAEAAEALQQQLDSAAARLEAAAAAAAEQAVQRWASEALPPLLQPMQEAVAATADLAASVAAEVAGLAGKAGQLAEAHANQEQRLCRAEERSMAANSGGGPASVRQLEALGEQVHSLQAGHARLDEAMQGLRQQTAAAAQQAAAAAQQAAAAATPQRTASRQGVAAAGPSPELDAAFATAAELPSLRRQLAVLADQQAQQAGTSEVLQSGAV